MSPSRMMRVRRAPAALALLTVAVAGCSAQNDAEKAVNDAADFMSNAKTCTELVKIAAGRLDDVRKQMDSPAELEQTLRITATELEAEAAKVDDAELKKAINTYVAKVRRVATRAANGEEIEIDAVQKANGALADACT